MKTKTIFDAHFLVITMLYCTHFNPSGNPYGFTCFGNILHAKPFGRNRQRWRTVKRKANEKELDKQQQTVIFQSNLTSDGNAGWLFDLLVCRAVQQHGEIQFDVDMETLMILSILISCHQQVEMSTSNILIHNYNKWSNSIQPKLHSDDNITIVCQLYNANMQNCILLYAAFTLTCKVTYLLLLNC